MKLSDIEHSTIIAKDGIIYILIHILFVWNYIII